MIEFDIGRLLDIGIALTKEKDYDKLLLTILDAAMDITRADAGSLYITDANSLVFKIMITRSTGYCKGGKDNPVNLPPVEMVKGNVCACAALEKRLINIPDVYDENDEYDFSGPKKYDALTGYKTVSQLVIPMENDRGDVIGVLQLINATDKHNNIIPFDTEYETVIQSLASQAGISIANMNYAEEISDMLDSFVQVMSTGIDARTPYNANHTRNMALYGGRFIDWLNNNTELHYTPEEKKALLMSIWLHDIGKLVIPLEVMDKSTRLGSKLEAVNQRLCTIGLLSKIRMLEGSLSESEYDAVCNELTSARELISKADTVGFLTDDMLAAVTALGEIEYTDTDGTVKPWLTPEELEALSVRKGTLTAQEREIMENHAVMTAKMLREMHFPKHFKNVPLWAAEHHELLNGSGYPNRICGEDIPTEVRIITILDVFDALTARDRPYKPPLPEEKAFEILDKMAQSGQLDKKLLDLFKQSNAY